MNFDIGGPYRKVMHEMELEEHGEIVEHDYWVANIHGSRAPMRVRVNLESKEMTVNRHPDCERQLILDSDLRKVVDTLRWDNVRPSELLRAVMPDDSIMFICRWRESTPRSESPEIQEVVSCGGIIPDIWNKEQ